MPSELLVPRDIWADVEASDAQARRLAAMFRDNFDQYAEGVSGEVVKAGPAA